MPLDDYAYELSEAIFHDFDCNNPNNPDPNNFCHGWWLKKGVSDGLHGVPTRKAQVPERYQADYQEGHDQGAWFRLENPGVN